MIHTLRGLGSDTEKIEIEELEDSTILICCSDLERNILVEQSVEIDLEKLHSLIGTLLHVQAKLKNKR